MKKIFSKVYIVLIALLCLLLTACQAPSASSSRPQEEIQNVHQEQLPDQSGNALQVPEEKQELSEPAVEQEVPEEHMVEVTNLEFELPDDVFIIDVSWDYKGNQKALTLKNNLLQFWENDLMVCQKTIPAPAKISIGSDFNSVIGNPYISKDGKLVLIQSYTTSQGEQKLDYTIFVKNCSKIVPSLIYDGYVFQNSEGKYGLVFYRDAFAYDGFVFNTVDSNFALPKPTTIWLNESTVKSVNFASWGTTSYHYQDISAISVRLDVESYGELDISKVGDSFDPVEVDDKFVDLLNEKFAPKEYNERLSKLNQTINAYRQFNQAIK